MPEAPFVHLHVHSEYSILDGACRIPALAARAAEYEMPAVGLTDHGSMAGAIELYREARKHGVKPILGCEVYVADDRGAQAKGYAHLTLLAQDNAGYGNLIKLSSSATSRATTTSARRSGISKDRAAAMAAPILLLSGRYSRIATVSDADTSSVQPAAQPRHHLLAL